MSLHAAEDQAPAPGREGEAPAPGAWGARRARELAQRAREAEGRREAVRRRLKWASPGGRSLADLERGLGWPGGTTGVPVVLRELAERGEAHEREGVWYAGPGPASVGGGDTPPVTGALGSAAAAATSRDLVDPRGAQGSVTAGRAREGRSDSLGDPASPQAAARAESVEGQPPSHARAAPTTGASPVDEDPAIPRVVTDGADASPGAVPSNRRRGDTDARRLAVLSHVQESPGITVAELERARKWDCSNGRLHQHVVELELLERVHRVLQPREGQRPRYWRIYPGPSTAPAVEPREGAVHPDGGGERGGPALPAEVSTSPDAHVVASALHTEAGPPTGGVVAQPDSGESGRSPLADGVGHRRPVEGDRQPESAGAFPAPAAPSLPATSGGDRVEPAEPPPAPLDAAGSPEVCGSGIPEVRWVPHGEWAGPESGWHDVATIPLRDVLVRWASGDVQRWVSLGPDDPDLATATGWRELPAERVATPPRPAPDPMYVAATLRQQLGEAEDRLVSAELDLAAERTELGEARADLALVDRVLDTLGVPQAGPRAFRLGWIVGRSEGR